MLIMDLISKATDIMNMDPTQVPTFKRILASAQKFELAPDFAAAAELLAADFDGIMKALPYCRLPYKNVWMEVAQTHRPRFAAAPIHVPGIQSVPIRVGFLLQAMNEDNSIIHAYEFWVLKIDPDIVQCSTMAMRVDPREASNPNEPVEGWNRLFNIESSDEWKKAAPDTKRILHNVIRPFAAPFVDPVIAVAMKSNAIADAVAFELGAADWSGESAYLMAVLALVNTINATTRKEVDQSGINKSRIKRREAPLNNHYVLSINPRIKKSMSSKGRGATDAEIRAHLVRGHWKVRKTGIYWWSAYTRGRGGPLIDKSYKVT